MILRSIVFYSLLSLFVMGCTKKESTVKESGLKDVFNGE